MSSAGRILAALVVACALAALTALFSRLPWQAEPSQTALVRLSWRAVGERVEECREPSEEELAALPRHMRIDRVCEGRVAPFRLTVELDGASVFDGLVRASGAREDRPVYVFREFRVAPGRHHIAVRFEPDREDGPGAGAVGALVLEEVATLAPRQVALVTHDSGADRLSLRTPPK